MNYLDSKKSVVLLGGNILHRGFELLRPVLNIEKIIVIDWNESPDYKGDIHYQLDIKDYEAICKLPIDWDDVAFVYTSADIAVETQIKLHERMGLKHPSHEAVKNALIKGNMRDCWLRDGILNKYSVVITDIAQFERSGNKYIFKPNCSSGSRGITILEGEKLCPEEIEKAISIARDASMDNACIVEEFVEGTEYTVDMLGDDNGNVAVYGISKKYHTPYNTSNKIATKLHYAPSDVDRRLLEKIAAFGQACYRSIGLSNSFGHLEIIVKPDETIVPVEIGARSSGYIATTLINLINDEPYLGKYCQVIHGESVADGLIFDGTKSSMYYFYDIKPGNSVADVNLMDYLPVGIKSYACDRSRIVKGSYFPVINADHERYGFEILGGLSTELTIEAIKAAEDSFNNDFIE